MGMRYYPKHGLGIKFIDIDTYPLDEFESNVEELITEGKQEEADELEEQGPDSAWDREVLSAIRDWSGDHYDQDVIDAFINCYGVEPMWVGELTEERGGEISGVSGFDYGEYVIFNVNEQDEKMWQAFLKKLEENNISLVEGAWSQLG